MEAEVLNEITLEKPVLDTEVYVNIPEALEVKHNLNTVRDYVKKLNEFYGNIINIDVDFATSERTKLNQLLKQVENLRKEKVAEFKKPIDDFESTAKETEKDLKSIIESMKLIIDKEKQRLADEKFKKNVQAKKAWFLGRLLFLRGTAHPIIPIKGIRGEIAKIICVIAHYILVIFNISAPFIYKKLLKVFMMKFHFKRKKTQY